MIYKINSFWLNEIWFMMIQGIEMCIFIVTINIFLYKFIKQYNEFIFSVFSFVLNIILLSVQFSSSVVSNSLRRHGLQHAGLPCLSPTPGACSDPCPWSRWCHPTISSSVAPFSSCLQSFPASGSFPMSQFSVTVTSQFWFLINAWNIRKAKKTKLLPIIHYK